MYWQTTTTIKNSVDAAAAKSDARDAQHKANEAWWKVRELEKQVDHLTLVCQSMWELLRDQHGIDERLLDAKVLEVDFRDGKQDGQIRMQTLTCGSCGRPTNSRRDNCLMCGALLDKQHVMEG